MVRKNRNRQRRSITALALLAATAMLAVGCGGGEASESGVASLADIEAVPATSSSTQSGSEPDPGSSSANDTADTSASSADEATDSGTDSNTDGATETGSGTSEANAGDTAPIVEDGEDGEDNRTEEEMALDFVACMRADGIDMDDPTVRADGSVQLLGPGGLQRLSEEDFQQAAQGCTYLIENATFYNERPDLSEIEDRLLEFAQCLRAEGLEVTDPDMSDLTAGPSAIFGEAFDPQDPANSDAISACQQFLPNAGGS